MTEVDRNGQRVSAGEEASEDHAAGAAQLDERELRYVAVGRAPLDE